MAKSRVVVTDMRPVFLLASREEAASKINDRIQKGEAIRTRPVNSEAELDSVRNDFYTWDEYNTQLLKSLFSKHEFADSYSSAGFGGFGRDVYLSQQVESFRDQVRNSIRALESVRDRLELIQVGDGVVTHVHVQSHVNAEDSKRVFVVHGHDEGAREIVARFLGKLSLDPIILHEKANEGKTVIEKFEKHSDVGYAVVLLTPDDEGRKKDASSELHDRARQNVVLELGYFIGKLGRGRVCALHKGFIEIPTDYLGVLYLPLDDSGGWQLKLAKELKVAGLPVDMNKVVED